jgi:hypothetical protein
MPPTNFFDPTQPNPTMNMITRNGKFLACAGVAMALCSTSLHAQVFANFTGGVGTSSADQYTGTAGSGWTNAWNINENNPLTTQTASVIATSPLNGGGNYLSFRYDPSDAIFANSALLRSWDTTVVSATTNPYRISFDYRVDSTSGFTGGNEYISLSAGQPSVASPTNNSTFFIRAYGGTHTTSSTGTRPGLTWLFYNGAKDSGSVNTNLFVSSGMAITEGTVYRFTIDLDPASLTYAATINNGSTSVTSSVMGYRTATASNLNNSTLNFNGFFNASTDTLTFSLDSVSVSQIPEPSTYAALIGLGALGFAAYRRRSRRA